MIRAELTDDGLMVLLTLTLTRNQALLLRENLGDLLHVADVEPDRGMPVEDA